MNFRKAVSDWAEYLGLGKIDLTANSELLKLMSNSHNISDVGFGVSQALLIIVESLLLRQKQTLFLEQPEIHLHLRMQMNRADFLLASSVKVYFINESAEVKEIKLDPIKGIILGSNDFFMEFDYENEKMFKLSRANQQKGGDILKEPNKHHKGFRSKDKKPIYLCIDEEHGAFEVFSLNLVHEGECNYIGEYVLNTKSPSTHKWE